MKHKQLLLKHLRESPRKSICNEVHRPTSIISFTPIIRKLHPIIIALHNKELDKVHQLMKQHTFHNYINSIDYNGNTAFSLAVSMGNLEIVAKFLEFDNLDINYPNKYGQTPLMFAATLKDPKIFSMILQYPDVNTNITDKRGYTPVDYAKKYSPENVEIIIQLLKLKYDITQQWRTLLESRNVEHGFIPSKDSATSRPENHTHNILSKRCIIRQSYTSENSTTCPQYNLTII